MSIYQEAIHVIIHLSYGFLCGFFYLLINHNKKTIIKDISFSICYILLYLFILDRYLIITHPYLICISLLYFFLTLSFKRLFNKQFIAIYYLLNSINKFLLYIIYPEIFKLIKIKLIQYHIKRKENKLHPYLKKSNWELF